MAPKRSESLRIGCESIRIAPNRSVSLFGSSGLVSFGAGPCFLVENSLRVDLTMLWDSEGGWGMTNNFVMAAAHYDACVFA